MIFFSDKNFTKKKIKFNAQFVVTKESQIENIKILEISDALLEVNLKNYIKKGEKFFNNRTGKDILYNINQVINFSVEDDYYRGSNNEQNSQEFRKDKEVIKIYKKGNSFYLANNFKKAVEIYEQIKTLGPINNSEILESIYISLGVSYLANENFSGACESFNKAGGLTNFKTRNYIINFCNKK